jgi:D-alanine-D-alanine ligase
MRIGLSYDIKGSVRLQGTQPEDALEEYDSPETVNGIAAAIESLGHATVRLGGGQEFLRQVVEERVDLVFNISEGLGTYRGREAQVPSVLEMLGIPYSGSDPLSLAVSLDKALTKRLVGIAGVTTPEWRCISNIEELEAQSWEGFPFPAFVKPAYEGSSKGIRLSSKVENEHDLWDIVHRILDQYKQPALVEQFIEGDEITVGIIGNKPPEVVGVMRVLYKCAQPGFIYSLEVKRDWEKLVDYECPARLSAQVTREIERAALKSFEVLGCRDVSRVDFRVSPEGKPFFLEINPLPGLNPYYSDLPIMARKVGISYQRLISRILGVALERCSLCA